MVLQAALGFSKAQFAMFDWRPELGSTLDLVSLDGDVSKNRRFKAPAFMAVHYINSETPSLGMAQSGMHICLCTIRSP